MRRMKTVSYRKILRDKSDVSLNLAAEYLHRCRVTKKGSEVSLSLLGLRDVVEAQGGVGRGRNLEPNWNRENPISSLPTVSRKGNPPLSSLPIRAFWTLGRPKSLAALAGLPFPH